MGSIGEQRLGDLKRIECDIQVRLQAACSEQTAVTYECVWGADTWSSIGCLQRVRWMWKSELTKQASVCENVFVLAGHLKFNKKEMYLYIKMSKCSCIKNK